MKKNKIIFLILSLLFLLIGSSSYALDLNSSNVLDYCPITGTECDLVNKDIQNIAVNTFINHTVLEILHLEENQIAIIKSGAFNDLSNLTELHLSDNQLSNIESGAFLGLDSLYILYLDFNQIETIRSGAFLGLSNLGVLGLGNNQITNIESGTFVGFNDLQELYLNDNQISNIAIGAFNGLNTLFSLALGENLITTIQPGTFMGLTNLVELFIDSNQITTIESGVFIGLDNLEELMMRYNQTSIIEPGAFLGLSNLYYLTLTDNQIANIQPGVFVGLDNLNELQLNNNVLESLPCDIMRLNNLSYFNADENLLSGSSLSLDMKTFLNQKVGTDYTLNPSDPYQVCGVLPITGELNSFNIVNTYNCPTTTTSCDLSNKGIQSIAVNTFVHHPTLEILYLEDNLITTIKPGMLSGANNLQQLYLGGNQIANIEQGDFIGPDKLEELYLNGNEISNIQGKIFIGLENLVELHLQDNKIADIGSDTFLLLNNLGRLYLGNNQIVTIQAGAFNGLSNLQELHVEGNQIANIQPGAFNGLNNLPVLDLNNNQLSDLPCDIMGLNNLSYFSIDNNPINESNLSQDMKAFLHLKAGTDYTIDPTDPYQTCGFLNSANIIKFCPITATSCDLNFGWVKNVAVNTFMYHTVLEYLNLEDNQIVTIQAGVFNGLSGLKELYFDNGQLTNIEAGTFLGLENLNYLQLDSNHIKSFPCDIMHLTNLIDTQGLSITPSLLSESTLSLDMKSFLNQKANTNYILDKNDPYQVCGVFEKTTTNGNGGGISITKDYCPNSDNSSSYYDGSCDKIKEENTHNAADDQTTGTYTQEFIDGYLWGHKRGFTTAKTIQRAHIEKHLTRKELAKILTIYSTKFLKKEINTEISCDFTDTKTLGETDQAFITHSCQLGLMGLNSDGAPTNTFNPRNEVTRAEFGTAFSRLLYGNKNNTDNNDGRYTKHLEALKNNGIMKQINLPNMKELFGNVLLILMRLDS